MTLCYIPARNQAAVILLYGYGANRLEMFKRAAILASHGCRYLRRPLLLPASTKQ